MLVAETGKTLTEADTEVTRAVDLATTRPTGHGTSPGSTATAPASCPRA